MSLSFSINSKPQSNRPKRPPTASFSDAAASDSTSGNYLKQFSGGVAASEPPTRHYVTEFSAGAPPEPDSKIKPIAPIPNVWRPNKKLKNLPNLPQISESNDSVLQFELDTGSNPEASDNSMAYGLNLRQTSAGAKGGLSLGQEENILDLELRKLREDLKNLPEDPGMDEYNDVPVEGYGAALLSGYGWEEGRGIGRNAKEDVKICEVTRKAGRGGLGFTGDFPEDSQNDASGNNNGNIHRKKADDRKERKEKRGFDMGREVRIVSGREIGTLGKIVEARHGGDMLVLRITRNNEKVKVRARDVALLGSAEEESCLRKLKELKIKKKDVGSDSGEKNLLRKSEQEEKSRGERVNWLKNNIRVRIVSEELKGGRLFLKKGVVVDVVGPGICDISMDESRELVQEVDQECLETALPKRGGPVLVLYGRHKGVYGSLLERNSDKEIGVVQDADTREMVNVRLEQIAEYTGDPSDVGY